MLKSIAVILACVTLGVSGQLLLKTGMNKIGRIDSFTISEPISLISKIFTNPIILFALSLYVFGTLLWLIVLSRENLSFAYPILGLSYVLVVVASKVFLSEPISLMRVLGAAIISIGVIIITRS